MLYVFVKFVLQCKDTNFLEYANFSAFFRDYDTTTTRLHSDSHGFANWGHRPQ